MTTRTSFPQRGQRISTSEPLSPLHNLYPHIGQDAYAGHRGERFEPPDRVKGMAFEVTPFCWIVKFSGITRFLYQFWKILPKYCGRKEKDHNILWSKWYSRRESNPQRPLRRGLLYPFNYGSIFNCLSLLPAGICRFPAGASAECRRLRLLARTNNGPFI